MQSNQKTGGDKRKLSMHTAANILRTLGSRLHKKTGQGSGPKRSRPPAGSDSDPDPDSGPDPGCGNSDQLPPICEIVLLPDGSPETGGRHPESEGPRPDGHAPCEIRGRGSFRQSKSTMNFSDARKNKVQKVGMMMGGEKKPRGVYDALGLEKRELPESMNASARLQRAEGTFCSQSTIGRGGALLPTSNTLNPIRCSSIADCASRSPTVEFLPMYSELCKTKNLKNEIRDVWRCFDQDGDGSISMRELANVMAQFGQNPSEVELKEIIEQVDEDGDGRICWTEFSKLMDSQFHELDKQEQKMRRAFDYFDLKKDRFIDKDELYTVLTRLGDQLTLADAEEMIRAADNDHDGLVSYAEFVEMMSYHLAQAMCQ